MQEIKGIARVKFLLGKLEEWKRLTAEAMPIVPTKDNWRPAEAVRTVDRAIGLEATNRGQSSARL